MRARILAALLGLVLTGCSAADDTQPQPTTVVETPASPTPASAEDDSAKVGQRQVSESSTQEFTVSVLRIRRPFRAVLPSLPERRAYEYAAIDARLCVKRNDENEEVQPGWLAWSLGTPSGNVIQALSSWSDDWWNEPLYPTNRSVKVGRCVRGWVVFEVKKETKIETVTYSPSDMNALEWLVRP